jgi:hypothetical protein
VIDPNVAPQYDVPAWNETRWFGCWNPDDGVGLYVHTGRFRRDLDMWWAQVAAYLPDGQLCVDRLWGRNLTESGVRMGGLDVTLTDEGWVGRFDGVGELTTIENLAAAPRGSSAPIRSVRWEVTATGVTPAWDKHTDASGDVLHQLDDHHIQQGFMTSGQLRVGGEEFRLDGVGFNDHSTGVRDWTRWHSHTFLMIVGAEWTGHLMMARSSDGSEHPPRGAIHWRDGRRERITRVQFPPMQDAAGAPVTGELIVELESGERFEFTVELIHGLPITITEENDNINGVGWDLAGDPVVIVEGKGRVTARDGSVAYCFHERSARRARLAEPARRAS